MHGTGHLLLLVVEKGTLHGADGVHKVPMAIGMIMKARRAESAGVRMADGSGRPARTTGRARRSGEVQGIPKPESQVLSCAGELRSG